MSNVLSLEFHAMDVYSLAVLNSGIPLIDEIIIKNDCEYNVKNLEVEVSSAPSFFAAFTKKISDVSSGRYVIISKCDLDIDTTKLMYAVKTTNVTLTVKVKNSGETLISESKNVLLLPYDHIPPVSVYTELISSFVTPAQKEIDGLTVSVEEKLRNNDIVPVNRDSWSLENKAVTREIIRAVYDAVKDLKITFNTQSVVSESAPFKIKLPETTLLTRNGNAFEIALLFCSIAENLRLRSFLTFCSDKVLVGFFYSFDSFDTCVSDDGRCLHGLEDGSSDRFCVIDTSSVISGVNVSFDDSLLTAQKAIDRCDSPIVLDIYRSRVSGYPSLPDRIRQNGDVIFEPSKNMQLPSDVVTVGTASLFGSSDKFTERVRDSILSRSEKNRLINVDVKRSVLLIGSSKYVVSKFILNGKVLIKNLPLNDFVKDTSDVFAQIARVNENINVSDMSGTLNCIHSKESLNRRILSVIEDGKRDNSAICLTLGTISYVNNGEKTYSPLFFVSADFDVDHQQGVYVKLATSRISVNTEVIGILSKRGMDTSAFNTDESLFDKYDEVIKSITDGLEDSEFEFFDTVSITTVNVDGQSLLSIATEDYFKKSSILSKMFSERSLDSNTAVELDTEERISVPYSLDSSQTKALHLAKKNECSVIKGANGSGKTLLSASIAFSDLSDGKRVLYVTDSNGNARDFMEYAKASDFDDFVMEIYDKPKAVNTFDLSVYSPKQQDASGNSEAKQRLAHLIDRQNLYYENLHKVNEIGFSLYEAASQYERYRSFPYSVNFSNAEISRLSRNDVVAWLDCVSSVAKAGADCKEPYSNPLSLIGEKNFSYDFKSRATISLNAHSDLTKRFLSAQEQLTEYLGVEVSILKEKQTASLIKMLHCILDNGEKIHYGIFGRDSIESDFSRIETLTLQCDDLFDLKKYVETNFTKDVVSLDCDALLSEWRSALSRFAFTRTAALNSVKNKLRVYCLDPRYITNENLTEALSKIARYKNSLAHAEDSATLIFQITGIDVKSSLESNECDVFGRIKESVRISQEYLALISDVYDSEKTPDGIYTYQSNLFKSPAKVKHDVLERYGSFETFYHTYTESEKELAELLKIDLEKAKEENHKIWYYYVNQLLDRMIDNIDLLKYWCFWNVEKEKAISLGLEKVVALYESEQISSSDLKNAFLKGFFKSVTEYFLSCESFTSEFSSDSQNESLAELYEYLERYRTSLSVGMRNTISSRFADYCKENKLSFEDAEMALKKNFAYEINSGADASDVKLLQSAKPCFVCRSPRFLSLFKTLPEFDTAIIDISSSKMHYSYFMLLPIAKKVVIIDTDNGIKNQLRFSDLFVSFGAPSTELNWLYTSNFASQVTNELFYHNTLTSFLSAKSKKNGINVIRQSGVFDAKNTRVNVIEASAVVDEILRIKSDSPQSTVGVYALTDEQRAFIELLYNKRNSSIVGGSANEKNKNYGKLFIRSLAHSEYDACDYVIFSTVISTDEKSRYNDSITKSIPELSDDFGVTALENVLLSAKKELTVITSLNEKELVDFKTTERGYCLFKKMMLRLLSDNILTLQGISSASCNENPIIREVYNHIESLGYKAELNIGINKCKIDVAVKGKGEDEYMLGIVFDESVYLNSDDFIGRDLMLRSLEDLGNWKLLRIYTVDWFENHSKQLDMITSALKGDSFKKIFD